MGLLQFGTILALIAASAAYYGLEGWLVRRIVPYPLWPFQWAGALAAFCAVKAVEAAAGWAVGWRARFRRARLTRRTSSMGKKIAAAIAVAGFGLLAAASGFTQNNPPSIEADVKKILENQERILTMLVEIQKELKIVKVRATQK